MLQSPETWVAVAFIIIAAIGLYYGLRPVLSGLDERAARIRREIEEAEQLREEAQKQLAESKRKQREAQREAEEILEHAKTEAKRIRENAEKDLEAQLERRERQTVDKIEQAEHQALREVRNRAVDVAVAATERLLRDNLTDNKSNELIDAAIKDVSQRMH